jgi:hypothetical protein
MSRYLSGRREGYGGRRRRWPRSRAGGCLLWIVLLIAILIVLSVMFGGFQKGTKESGLGWAGTASAASLYRPAAG